MKIIRYALLALAALMLIATALVGYIAATFDAKDYQPRLIELVRQKTGRTLAFVGDVKLSFWPDPGVELGPLTLSERGSDEAFAELQAARLKLRLAPLLSRQFHADELRIRGASVRIVRDAEGRLNVDDLFGGGDGRVEFDIARLTIEDSRVAYEDARSGARYIVSGISAETGRLMNRVPTRVALTARAARATDDWRVDMTAAFGLVFDLDARVFDLNAVTADIKIRIAADTIESRITASKIRAAAGEAALADLEAVIMAKGPAGTTRVKASAPLLERKADDYRADGALLELNLVRGATTLDARAAAALRGHLAVPSLAVDALRADFTLAGPPLAGQRVSGNASGSAVIDIDKEGVRLNLAGNVGGSGVRAELTAAGFAAPVYTFKVDVDRIDLDRYASSDAAARPKTGPAAAQNLLEPLAALPATGTLRIGLLKTREVRARDVTLVLR